MAWLYEMKKPWGSYKVLSKCDGYLVKTITIKPYQSISLQSHKHRDEVWTIVKGSATIDIGDFEVSPFIIWEQDTFRVERGTKHRISNDTNNDLVLVEVQFGDILDENDITRFEDKYGRVK